MKPLRFTEADAERAHREWGANCGPGALAAVLGMTLDEIRPHMGDFEQKHYTNPTLMWAALDSVGTFYTRQILPRAQRRIVWPLYGLARIQWEGPWTTPGVPPRVAYRHTHWVGTCWSHQKQSRGVFDINCMNNGGWVSLDDWSQVIVPHILKVCEPKATGGWYVTHAVSVTL